MANTQHDIRAYNELYAEYVHIAVDTFGQSDITEQCLLNAHEWAASFGKADVRPPEGWVQANATSDGDCGRCLGTGWTSFAPDNGICYQCNMFGQKSRTRPL